jgi:hypothetical protein
MSPTLGAQPVLMAALAAALSLAAVLLLGSAVFLAFWPAAFSASNSPIDRWAPTVMIFAMGVGLGWVAFGVGRAATERRAIARHAGAARIVEGDLLAAKSVARLPGTIWIFAYSQDGRRYIDRRVGLGPPLFLDGLETRGAVVLGKGGAELIFANLHPLVLAPRQRALIEADVARRAAAPVGSAGVAFRALEAAADDVARDYVQAFGLALSAGGRDRRRLIERRQAAARRLPPDDIDILLASCRRAAGV